MARTPTAISKAAKEAWGKGDEEKAEKLSGVRRRQLRNRLGPPGRAHASATGSGPALPPPSLTAGHPGSVATEPTDAEIEAVDTLVEAHAILRALRAKMLVADDVRYGSLAEKALAAINRIEQIEKNRPRVTPPDEVTRRLVTVREAAIKRIVEILEDRGA